MTSDNGTSDIISEIWLTPKDAADKYNIPLRKVYRLIERKEIKARRAGAGGRLTEIEQTSLQNYIQLTQIEKKIISRGRQLIDETTATIGKNEQDNTRGEYRNALAIQLATKQAEIEKLNHKIEELRQAELVDKQELGRLQGRLESLEKEATTSQNREQLLLWAGLILLAFIVILALVVVIAK